jgi:hypothetical protein
MTKPKVSDALWFWPGALIPSLAGKGPLASIVIKVNSERSVDVVFFTELGEMSASTGKLLWQRDCERPAETESYCEWPELVG